MTESIPSRVHTLYWEHDFNCATTTLICLGELFRTPIQPQTLAAAVGMHGAGGFRAQCGLVEGALMFIGIYLSEQKKSASEAAALCHDFAEAFTTRFGSLQCRDLRPGGFQESDPPHACEALTAAAIDFSYRFIQSKLGLSETP